MFNEIRFVHEPALLERRRRPAGNAYAVKSVLGTRLSVWIGDRTRVSGTCDRGDEHKACRADRARAVVRTDSWRALARGWWTGAECPERLLSLPLPLTARRARRRERGVGLVRLRLTRFGTLGCSSPNPEFEAFSRSWRVDSSGSTLHRVRRRRARTPPSLPSAGSFAVRGRGKEGKERGLRSTPPPASDHQSDCNLTHFE